MISRAAGMVLAAAALLQPAGGWRSCTAKELDAAVPLRAPVASERVETERTSMSGVVDRDGRVIAAAVLITAGYSAAGKYSDYLTTQTPLVIGDVHLPAGSYLLGWTRGNSGLDVEVYQSADGKPVAHATAAPDAVVKRVEQVRIWPPQPEGKIQIGRFTLPFRTDERTK